MSTTQPTQQPSDSSSTYSSSAPSSFIFSIRHWQQKHHVCQHEWKGCKRQLAMFVIKGSQEPCVVKLFPHVLCSRPAGGKWYHVVTDAWKARGLEETAAMPQMLNLTHHIKTVENVWTKQVDASDCRWQMWTWFQCQHRSTITIQLMEQQPSPACPPLCRLVPLPPTRSSLQYSMTPVTTTAANTLSRMWMPWSMTLVACAMQYYNNPPSDKRGKRVQFSWIGFAKCPQWLHNRPTCL